MISRQQLKLFLLYALFGVICFLFFLLGRVSMLWESSLGSKQESTISGVTLANPKGIEKFRARVENFEEKTEISVFQDLKKEESQSGKEDAQFVASSRGKYYYPMGSD